MIVKLVAKKYPQGREVLSQENQQVFVLNGIQTQSGYCYNLGNDLASMAGLVDIIRLSPESDTIFDTLQQFRQNEQGQQPLTTIHHHDCNGYWRKLAGLELVE